MQAQEELHIAGTVVDRLSFLPLPNVEITIEGTEFGTTTDAKGQFALKAPLAGDYILVCSLLDFATKRLPVFFKEDSMDLGIVVLEKDITIDQTDNLVTLTEGDLTDDGGSIPVSLGLLQATRDVFLNRAAFDFGQAFFRVRGYDSKNGQVLINGILMNKFFDGRPQWNNWGGLNDVIRNQEFTQGLAPSDYTFGGILGNTNIDTRPSGLRTGMRISASASNRTYAGRLMATYNTGLGSKGLGYAISGSRRWAGQGYIDGTIYDAYSFHAGLEYQFNANHSLALTTIMAKNRRGRSAAMTEEVFELMGNRYNPYWGYQNGDIRNTRERDIFEPIILLNHYVNSENLRITSGIAYQFGHNARSRLGYFKAPNPDPTYYRYLPSFYVNNTIGADFTNAALTREGFLQNPQVNWNYLHLANTNSINGGKASYVLYDDMAKDSQISLNSAANLKLGERLHIDFGLGFRKLSSENFAQIKDLLGADYHEDVDPFSNTRNDINGELNKNRNDLFGYHYDIEANSLNAFVQFKVQYDRWDAFASGSFSTTAYQRNGLFQNERFLQTSLGNGEKIDFSNIGLKGGLSYKISGRHWLRLHTAYLTQPTVLQNTFVNPRESNEVVPNIQNELITSVDLNYYMRLPDITARLTGFYTRFEDLTDINFFFVDSGLGSDFVQEVITDLDKLHMGIEAGLEYQVSSSVKLSAVANIGKYIYANDPSVTINFDTAGQEEELINQEGAIDLGIAGIKDYKLSQGPQKAMAFGAEYRDPSYWWVGATANYLANNYAGISTITRTQSFLLDPDTGERFTDATQENVNRLLAQKKLDDFYLLNLVGGKSWLVDGRYFSVFVSVNNVFDTTYRTGGFEQSRNGNFGQLQQDNLRNNPTFAPKYWYGYGRTYFLNVAFSF